MKLGKIKIFVLLLTILLGALFIANVVLNIKNDKFIKLDLDMDNDFILYKDIHLNLNISYMSMFVNYDNLANSNRKLHKDIDRLVKKYPSNQDIKKIRDSIYTQYENIELIKRANSILINSVSFLRHSLPTMFGNDRFSSNKKATKLRVLSRTIIDLSYNIKFDDKEIFKIYTDKIDKIKSLKFSNPELVDYQKNTILHVETIYKYAKILRKNVLEYHRRNKQIIMLYDKATEHITAKHTNLKNAIDTIQIIQIVLLLVLIFLILWLLNLESRHEQVESKLKKIIDKNIISSTTDTKGIITDVSQAFCDVSGYSKKELIGKSHNIIRDPIVPSETFKKLWDTIQAGKIWNSEIRNVRKDGTYFWVQSIIEPVFNTKGKITSYFSIKTDITSKKALEELSEKQEITIKEQTKLANEQRDKAIEASKAKSEFLANMSHEIRTPLNAILGFIKILKESETDKTKQNYLNIIESSSGTLLEIINDILDFSKIESKKLKIDKTDFNPSVEFKLVENLFKAKFTEKNILFTCRYKNLPECLHGDILRIKQVISNLLSNAIKFTPENKSIILNFEYSDKSLYISVKDEGFGISKKYQKEIFKAFSQEDSSTTRKYGGTGLGLAISHNLVKAMGGKLKLKSKVGEGSEFYFSLPLKTCKKLEDIDHEEDSVVLKGKVLLAEDNKANQMFMKILLKKIGLKSDIANDGVEAVEMYQKQRYDVVLMDENMPNMCGTEATVKITKYEKQNGLKHTPIIALTANALKGDRERFLEAGMDEYLTKPVDKEKLVKTLKRFLKK